MSDDLLTAKQAAWMADMKPDTFARLVRDGVIPGQKSVYRGRVMLRVRRADVEAFAAKRKTQPVRGQMSKPADNIPRYVRDLCVAIEAKVKAGERLKDIFARAGVHYSSYRHWCINGNPSMTAAQSVANAIGYEYVLKPIDRTVKE